MGATQGKMPKSRGIRVLVAGVSRSGTSWLGQALGSLPSAKYYYEPDYVNAEVVTKNGSGASSFSPYPEISQFDDGGPHRALWNLVFAGGLPLQDDGHLNRAALRLLKPLLGLPPVVLNPAVKLGSRAMAAMAKEPEIVIAKTVFAQFYLDWLAEIYQPQVVMIQRGPLNVVSSWRTLRVPIFDLLTRPSIAGKTKEWFDGPTPGVDDPELVKLAWAVGMLSSALGESLDRHPEWTLITHEDLIQAPVESLKKLVADLGLKWSDEVAEFLAKSNRRGEGITPVRITSEQGDRWKGRLTDEEVSLVDSVFAKFERKGWIRPI